MSEPGTLQQPLQGQIKHSNKSKPTAKIYTQKIYSKIYRSRWVQNWFVTQREQLRGGVAELICVGKRVVMENNDETQQQR